MKVLIILLVAITLALTAAAEETKDPMVDIIIDYTKNISELVEWSGDKTILDDDKPLFIAVVGKSDLAKKLKTLNRTKTAGGRKLTVRLVDEDLLPANAHVVIICLDDITVARKVIKKLTGSGTLTIAMGPKKVGAVMHFQEDSTEPGKLVCEISQSVAEAEKIVIQKALSLIAKIVE